MSWVMVIRVRFEIITFGGSRLVDCLSHAHLAVALPLLHVTSDEPVGF